MKPRNLSAEVDDNPALGLALCLAGLVEVTERQGAAEVVASSVIPTEMQGVDDAALVALGFVLGPVCEDDPLFRAVTLPDGWSRVSGGGAGYWTFLVDPAGRRRFVLFYKAAFYDRRAYLEALPRFGIRVRDDHRCVLVELSDDRVLLWTDPAPSAPEAWGYWGAMRRRADEVLSGWDDAIRSWDLEIVVTEFGPPEVVQ